MMEDMLVLNGSAPATIIVTWIQHAVAYTSEHGNPFLVPSPAPDAKTLTESCLKNGFWMNADGK